MPSEKVLIPRKMEVLLQGKEFCSSKKNYNYNVPDALEACQKEHAASSAPEVADSRIISPKENDIWQNFWTTRSLRATGKTKQGNAVVAYAHIPHIFCNPTEIRKAIDAGLRDGAGSMPEEEFYSLLALEDNKNVFVVDHKKLLNSPSDVIPLAKAIKHPQTIPFLGGKDRAESYLEQHKQKVGERIGIWHCDDLADEGPLGRLLVFGGSYNRNLLLGNCSLSYFARFVGIPLGAEGAALKIASPLEQLASKGTDVGNGLVVIGAEQISSDVYKLLTGKA